MPAREAAPAAAATGTRRPRTRDSGAGRPDRPGSPRRRRLLFGAGALAAIVVIWLLFSLFQPFAGGGSGKVEVTIPRGSSASTIADLLAKRGVISSAFFFEARTAIDGHRGDLKPGDYTLKHGMSYSATIAALVKGPAPNVVNITLPPGKSRREASREPGVAGLSGDYLAATKSSPLLSPASYGAQGATDLEGFLFPNTYQLKKGASVQTLVAKQLTNFKQEFAKVDLSAARQHNLTPYDVITIASMVEREAIGTDRPLVAAVIYNRLRIGMKLGIDATTRFQFDDWTQPLTASQLASPSPYNTRINTGLPPGPIGSPGLSALEAAAHPATSDYLYYVADPSRPGYHCFTASSSAFDLDVQRYQEAQAGQHPAGGCA